MVLLLHIVVSYINICRFSKQDSFKGAIIFHLSCLELYAKPIKFLWFLVVYLYKIMTTTDPTLISKRVKFLTGLGFIVAVLLKSHLYRVSIHDLEQFHNPAHKCLFKVINKNTKKGVKYVQSNNKNTIMISMTSF